MACGQLNRHQVIGLTLTPENNYAPWAIDYIIHEPGNLKKFEEFSKSDEALADEKYIRHDVFSDKKWGSKSSASRTSL